MIIRKATLNDRKKALNIAKELKGWFNEEGIKNMAIDFNLNSLVVTVENKKVVGFLCYTSYCGKMLLMWMGVRKESRRKGVGEKLLKWLEKEAEKLKLYAVEVETLPDEDEYEPYKQTRAFYCKHGFKRIAYKKARIEGWDDQIILEKKLT